MSILMLTAPSITPDTKDRATLFTPFANSFSRDLLMFPRVPKTQRHFSLHHNGLTVGRYPDRKTFNAKRVAR
jgi:hypothetical protein